MHISEIDSFLAELTELSNKYGIGIEFSHGRLDIYFFDDEKIQTYVACVSEDESGKVIDIECIRAVDADVVFICDGCENEIKSSEIDRSYLSPDYRYSSRYPNYYLTHPDCDGRLYVKW